MKTIARYFDGVSADATDGELCVNDDSLSFSGSRVQFVLSIEQVRIVPPVGNGLWSIELENNAVLQCSDKQIGQYLAAKHGNRSIISKLEGAWRWSILALVVTVLGTWAVMTWVVPQAARHIAFTLPQDLDAAMGRQSIKLLDQLMFDSSTLTDEQQQHIRHLFESIRSTQEEFSSYQLMFRSGGEIGANAFAVPGGIVIITDQMIMLAENDNELIAVLAHEVGHLAERHSLRLILQNSASAVLIAMLTGDLTNITALSATVPTVLMQSKYSRDFEREADAFSFQFLQRQGIDTDVLSQLLIRLETQSGSSAHDKSFSWFSSHPPSDERKED